jgi:hypothetical protein
MRYVIAVFAAWLCASAASAELSATVVMQERGARLWASVTLAGIEGCPTAGTVVVEWTSPSDLYESSQYEAPYRGCSPDGGTARTRAYRTVRGLTWKGKELAPARGVWRVRVLSSGKVLATAGYEVR